MKILLLELFLASEYCVCALTMDSAHFIISSLRILSCVKFPQERFFGYFFSNALQ